MTVENEDVVTLDEALESATSEITDDNQIDETQVANEVSPEVIEELEALQANEYMTAEQKDLFTLLNDVENGRGHQQHMLDRFGHNQSEYGRLANDNQQLRQQYDPVNQLLQPFEQQWKMQNGSTQAGLGSVLEMYKYATTDSVGFAKWLLKQDGKTLDEIRENEEYQDPALVAIQAENTKLKQQFQQFQDNSQRQTEQGQEQQRLGQIDSYRQQKDSNGNLKYPIFDQVLPSIMQLAQTEPNLSMDQAYGRIVEQLQGHFGGVAQPPQPKKIVTTAVDKTKAGKGSIKSKNKSGAQPDKSLDQILDEVIAAAS